MKTDLDISTLATALERAAHDAGITLPEYERLETYALADWIEANVPAAHVGAVRAAARAWSEARTVALVRDECPEITDLATLPDFWPLNCEAWHNDAVCFFRYRTCDRVGVFYIAATSMEDREITELPRMGVAIYTTPDGETEGELVASFAAETLDGFGFDVAERIVHLCRNPGRTLTACRFSFDDSPVWHGWTDGTTWNGFDNVWCDRATFEAVIAHFEAAGDTDGVAQMRELEPDDHGRYSFAYGYTAQVVEPE